MSTVQSVDGRLVTQWKGIHAALVRLERDYRSNPRTPEARTARDASAALLYAEARTFGFSRRALRQAVKATLAIPYREVTQLQPVEGQVTRVVLGPKPPRKRPHRRPGHGPDAGVQEAL